MKNKKSILLSLLLVFTMALGLVGCGKSEPVAIINGNELSEPLFKTYLFNIKMQMEQFGLGPEVWDQEIDGQTMGDMAKENALSSAVEMAIFSEKAKEMDIELTAEEKEQAKEITENVFAQSKDSLEAEGITTAAMEEMFQQITLSQKVVEGLAEQFTPSDDPVELNDFIQENKAGFEQVRAQHVLISNADIETREPFTEAEMLEAKKLAEEVLEKALAGEDMGELASEFSDDPGSKDGNGEYTFPRGQMVPEFEEVAFTLEEGEVHSEIVETAHGYHIIKTLEKLEANEEDMKEAFEEKQKMEYVSAEVDEWVKSAEVEKTELFDEISVQSAKPEADLEYEGGDLEEEETEEIEETEEVEEKEDKKDK